MVLEDADAINSIMEGYDKQTESNDEYMENIERRTRQVIQMAEVDYDDYLKALSTSRAGYSVVQRRDLDEIFINSYNAEWLRAWNANLDIKIVLDYFAVITYVTDYYSKDDTGTMEVIKAALQQAKSRALKRR